MPSTEAQQQALIDLYLNLPFNRFLNLSLTTLSPDHLVLSFPLRPEFIGNTHKQILHGGTTSSAIDAAGGLLALYNGFLKLSHLDHEEKMARLMHSSTIDLRVDYLRPGSGQLFSVSSQLLRSGRFITVTRTELLNERQQLLASGSATYLIGQE